MRYLALGDSISIDYYTEVPEGGAASQFAVKVDAGGADFQDLTKNGNVTGGVLEDLQRVSIRPEVVTLTVGGNDFLLEDPPGEVLGRINRISDRLTGYACPVILNTIYDPTDGDDSLSAEMGMRPERRTEYNQINNGIRRIARERGFILSDLEELFHGNGIRSKQPWIVYGIEPNLLGATAIAGHWLGLLRATHGRPGGGLRGLFGRA